MTNMILWKQPPIAKVYEALGALADNRVKLVSDSAAEVVSSSLDKTYHVQWATDFKWITSNDNASYWQGYLGYPIVAVLLASQRVSFDRNIAEALKGIPWKKINVLHKNDYSKTISEVLDLIASRGAKPEAIMKECERIHAELDSLNLGKPPQGRKPPKSDKQQSQENLL